MFDFNFIFGLAVIAGSQLGVLSVGGESDSEFFSFAVSQVELRAMQLRALFSLFIEF